MPGKFFNKSSLLQRRRIQQPTNCGLEGKFRDIPRTPATTCIISIGNAATVIATDQVTAQTESKRDFALV